MSFARPDAGGVPTHRAPIISLSNTTEFVTQETGASHTNINGQSDGEVNPARSISGGTAFTTTIPDDFQLWIPPLPRHGSAAAFID